MNDKPNNILTALSTLVSEELSVEIFHNEYGYGAALGSWRGSDGGAWKFKVAPYVTIGEALTALVREARIQGYINEVQS